LTARLLWLRVLTAVTIWLVLIGLMWLVGII
jgi:hypothetical protein